MEIGEGNESERLARDALQSHMRILRGTQGQAVITVSPSEPMLAIAAADALNDSVKIYQDAMNTLVNHLILRGIVIDRGMQGELCTRLLFTLARDKAIRSTAQLTGTSHKVQAISLSNFLRALLGNNIGISDERLRASFLSDLSNIWINFTHFVQLSKAVTELSPTCLLEAWSSGIAVQCAPFQPVIDGFLVCYMGNLDDPFDIKNLTAIPWQTKARSQAASITSVNQLTAPPITKMVDGKTIQSKTHPLVIFMDLGTLSQFQKNSRHVNLTFTTATIPTKRTWDGYARDNTEEPTRYCLNIRGHKSSTYDVMKDFPTQLDSLFQFLVRPDSFEEFLDGMDKDMQRLEEK